MRMLAHPARTDIELTSVFHALSDPVRLGIVVGLLHGGEQSTGGLAIPMNKSSLSHHLKILREAGVTFTRIQGTHRFLSLRREDLDARFPGLLDAIAAAAHLPGRAPVPIRRYAA
jgi:DNA-binding transcriptional ArsR family regulator